MAPESIIERKYSVASDVWSFGVLCWEIYSLGQRPYHDVGINAVLSHIIQGGRLRKPLSCEKVMFVNLKLVYHAVFHYYLRYHLLCSCWDFDADERPSFAEVHETLEGIAGSSL